MRPNWPASRTGSMKAAPTVKPARAKTSINLATTRYILALPGRPAAVGGEDLPGDIACLAAGEKQHWTDHFVGLAHPRHRHARRIEFGECRILSARNAA